MEKKKFEITTVVDCHETSPGSGIYYLEVDWKNPKIEPGQFVMINPLNDSSQTPRPFSVAYINRNYNSISILFKVVGTNTKSFSKLKKDDFVEISGPHGKPIPISETKKNYILVGGGIGTAALLLLARELIRPVTALLGGKSRSHILDDGLFKWYGCTVKVAIEEEEDVFVTDLLEKELKIDGGKSAVVACGPKLMLKRVAELCQEYGNECQVILEEFMACGVGSCKSCKIFGKDSNEKHVCTDGPAFDANWVDWEKLIPKEYPKQISKKPIADDPIKTVLVGKDGREVVVNKPFINASGCLGIEAIESRHVDISHVGALITKGVTFEPRSGNAMPRICEVPHGLMNSIGLENLGIKKFKSAELPRWLKTGKPVIVNISGFSEEEYAELAFELSDTEISGIEINVSCPNIKQKGSIFGLDQKMVYEIVKGVRENAPHMYLITKLSPMALNCVEIAKAAIEAGSDAISGINTILGSSVDIWTRKPKIAMKFGGISGPTIRPLALRIIRQLATANLNVPIIGIGGIVSAADACEFFLHGANVVAVGTGLFKNPGIFTEIHSGVISWMKYHGASQISDLIGQIAE